VHAPLTLSFAQAFIDVPREVGMEMFRRFDEIIATLNAIPRGSTIWESLLTSWLVVQVGDWRFHYKIDPELSRVVVVAAAHVSGSSAA
jgi:hypothetical protein